jgi:phage shock protein C
MNRHLQEMKSMSEIRSPLRRSRSGRMIGGVVSGLAKYFGLDVTLARVLYVVISICSAAFPGILVYLLFWILTPEEDYTDPRVISTQ